MRGQEVEPKSRLARRASAFAAIGLVWGIAGATPGCGNSTTGANATQFNACSLNSDCSSGLICALGRCRSQCVTTADCPGAQCVTDGSHAVCQSSDEYNTACNKPSDCTAPLACASDYRCRNLCQTDGDCNVLGATGRVCAADQNGVRYCATPSDVTGGVLTDPPPPNHPPGGVTEPDASMMDGATDGNAETGPGNDSGTDGSMMSDSGTDSSMMSDTGTDSSTTDSGTDGSTSDGGNDGATSDAGTDTGPPLALSVVSGDNQTGYIAQVMGAVTVQLKDSTTMAPVVGVPLTVTPSPGVAAQGTLQTDSNGRVVVLPRLGLTPGAESIQISYPTSNTVQVNFTANAPAAGTVFTILNATAQTVSPMGTTFPTPATTTPSYGQGVTADASGNIYYSDTYYLGEITTDGVAHALTNLTGTFSGNGGPPSSAGFGTYAGATVYGGAGLVTPQRFVAFGRTNTGNGAGFRQIDFSGNVISNYAGGGSATGTGILASTVNITTGGYAYLAGVVAGSAYLFDPSYTPQFLVVDTNGVLNPWTLSPPPGSSCSTSAVTINANQGVYSGATDAAGNIYIANGYICGTGPGPTGTPGIVKVAPNGTLTHVAGNGTGSTADSILATQAKLAAAPQALAVVGSYLYYYEQDSTGTKPRLRRISLTSGIVTTVAGGVTAAQGGDYVPAAGSPLSSTQFMSMATVGNNLVYFERLPSSNYTRLRMIWSP